MLSRCCAPRLSLCCCSACAPKFYRTSSKCKHCPSVALFILVAFVLVVAVCIWMAWWFNKKHVNLSALVIGEPSSFPPPLRTSSVLRTQNCVRHTSNLSNLYIFLCCGCSRHRLHSDLGCVQCVQLCMARQHQRSSRRWAGYMHPVPSFFSCCLHDILRLVACDVRVCVLCLLALHNPVLSPLCAPPPLLPPVVTVEQPCHQQICKSPCWHPSAP